MKYDACLRSCIGLANHINTCAEAQQWQVFDDQLKDYFESVAELEQQLMQNVELPLTVELNHLQQLHNKILTHALTRQEQISSELLLLHKNKQVSSSYHNNL